MTRHSMRIITFLAAVAATGACFGRACDPDAPNVSQTADTGSVTGGDTGSITGGDTGSITGGDTGSITGGDSGSVNGDVASFVAASGTGAAMVVIRRAARNGQPARTDTLRLGGRKVTLTIR